MMYKELDSIILTIDLPDHQLKKGDVGTIVLVHDDSAGYEVEFITLAGETIAVVTVVADQIRPVSGREIAHARPIEPAA